MNDPPSVPQAQCLESYVDDSKATVHFVQSTRLDIEESPLQKTVLRPCHVILTLPRKVRQLPKRKLIIKIRNFPTTETSKT